jgi:heme/copper-type cytochrome/quinol oxidase subunit 1
MHWIEKLSRAQRVVVVVALGVAFLAVGSCLGSLGQPRMALGWTAYAPLSAPSAGQPGWLRLIVWLALTCLWAVVLIRLLRSNEHEDSDQPPK